MTNQPAASLIICSRNRPVLLEETVVSVLAGSRQPAELVIVDQSSQPNPRLAGMGWSGRCYIRYIHSHASGLCRARNQAIAAASHDLLAFIDDDMLVPTDWFDCLMGALLAAGPDVVVTGRVLPLKERPGGFVPALVTGSEPHTYSGRLNSDVLAAGHMAMYRQLYTAVGPFDERLGAGSAFPAADDNDYGYRILQAGYAIQYTPQAVVYHKAWRDQSAYRALRRAYGLGKGGFYCKHLRAGDGFMLRRLLGDVALRLVRFPWRVLHRADLALGDLAYVEGVASGLLGWLRQEKSP